MMTTNQAAEIANVKRVTVLKWIERGILKAVRFGRDWQIDPQDLQALMALPRPAGRKLKVKQDAP